MIPIYSYTQSIVFVITYHPSYRKYTEERFFNGNVKCSRAQNTFQLLPACTCRDTILAWLLFKAQRSKRRGKMCESTITRGIMRVGVWKMSKYISPESNGANIFRNVHVRWECTRDAPTKVHGLSLSVVFALFKLDAVCALLVSFLNIFPSA